MRFSRLEASWQSRLEEEEEELALDLVVAVDLLEMDGKDDERRQW